MKKILTSVMLLMIACANVKAEDNHLYIQPNAGETLDWSIPTLQKMTFQNGNVVLTMKDGTSTYAPISSIKRMYICVPSANSITSVDGKSQCVWDGVRLQVDARPGASVAVYSVNGTSVMHTRLVDTTVDLQGLNRGMYIVNVDGQVFKIIKK